MNCSSDMIANIGDSRAFICNIAKQLSIDHEPNSEKPSIENKGCFVSNFPGNLILQKQK